MKPLRYLIVGAGGTGGALGAHLAKGGADVTLIARGGHLSAMRENGLTLTRPSGTFTVPVRAFAEQEYLQLREEQRTDAEAGPLCAAAVPAETPDVIFVCVKGYSIPEIVPFLRKAAGPETVVIPLLNLFDTGEILQRELPENLVTDGCIYISSYMEAPGRIRMMGEIMRVVFGVRDGTEDMRRSCEKGARQGRKTASDPGAETSGPQILRQVEADLKACGVRGILSREIRRDALLKFSYVSPQGACGLYYGVPAGAIQKEGEIRDCFAELVREIAHLSEAMGYPLEGDPAQRNLDILDKLDPEMTTSLQKDIARGGRSEIDGLIFSVVRRAKGLGLQLPEYERIAAALTARGLE